MNICDITNCIGISFEDLVERTGIPASTLSDIMSGRSDLSRCQAKTLQKLANGLELSMEELLDLEAVTQDLPAPAIRPVHKLIAPHAFVFFRNSMLYYLRGNILAQQGKTDEATEALKKALELDPENAYAKHDLEAISK